MPTLERFDAAALRDLVTTFRDAVVAHAAALNRLNVYPVPDGDTGTNMSRTLQAVVDEMDPIAPDDLEATCDAISHGSLMGARGNSGVILSQIMRGIAATMRSDDEARGDRGGRFADALQAASTGADQAVMKPIEGTILTVVRKSAEAARDASDGGGTLLEVVQAAHAAGREALANTPEQLAVLKEAGVVDAGGAGYLLLLDAALHVVDGVPLPEPDDSAGPTPDAATRSATRPMSDVGGELDVSELRYEVMYFLDLDDDRLEDFRRGWASIGDSIVVVGGDGLYNCHVHTNDVGAAVEVALDLDGRPRQIRVTDLFEEVDEEHARREAQMGSSTREVAGRRRPGAGAGLPPVTTAVVAVCSGDGLVELFGQLGVQGVVTGGQTMNPSTAELLDTVEHVNARQVVVLPNNKNIVPVAEQVDALTDKSVVVVPTTSMPEGLAALIVYDPEATGEENRATMAAASSSVTTGEVTRAVRDTTAEVGPVSEGDWIGLVRGDGIVACDASLPSAVTSLLDVVVDDHAELVTIITGAEAEAATTEGIAAWLADHHAAVEVEVHHGGQPLYPYLVGVE
ncbi:DAK2 domain-containing protein [Ilumatobacter sp.]|uniref:DAK2 domain-containing protein n=1 Tax=Ilumatobacter sp. TaxID=1967498 RepID=UPI003B5282EA